MISRIETVLREIEDVKKALDRVERLMVAQGIIEDSGEPLVEDVIKVEPHAHCLMSHNQELRSFTR